MIRLEAYRVLIRDVTALGGTGHHRARFPAVRCCATMSTFLKVIDTVDNYCVDPPREPLVKFLLPASSGQTEVTVGWIREPVLPYIRDASDVFVVSPDGVRFNASLDTFEKRTAAIDILCLKWRDAGLFSETICPKKWRNELYPIFYDPLRRAAFGGQEVAFAVERTCCSLFGFVTCMFAIFSIDF